MQTCPQTHSYRGLVSEPQREAEARGVGARTGREDTGPVCGWTGLLLPQRMVRWKWVECFCPCQWSLLHIGSFRTCLLVFDPGLELWHPGLHSRLHSSRTSLGIIHSLKLSQDGSVPTPQINCSFSATDLKLFFFFNSLHPSVRVHTILWAFLLF